MAEPACLGQTVLSFEGQLDGWCWYPDQPTERAVVEVLVNGKVVQAYKAARLRIDLRDLDMGDGYCGFFLPMPQLKALHGMRTVIEVRERRLGQIIGRIILDGDETNPSAPRMERQAAAMDALSAQLAKLADSLSPICATAFEELGRTLSHLSRHPLKRASPSRHTSLAACHDRLTTLPRLDLGWCPAPRISVILSAPPSYDSAELVALLSETAAVLHPLGVEFILLDHGTASLTALLATRVKHLAVVQTNPALGLGSAFNAAALSARGNWLAFADTAQLGTAHLAEACQDTQDDMVYLAIPGLVQADIPMPLHGLQCLLSRVSFMAIGGFDPTLETTAMWVDMRDKATMLGKRVLTWATPRQARPLRFLKPGQAAHG